VLCWVLFLCSEKIRFGVKDDVFVKHASLKHGFQWLREQHAYYPIVINNNTTESFLEHLVFKYDLLADYSVFQHILPRGASCARVLAIIVCLCVCVSVCHTPVGSRKQRHVMYRLNVQFVQFIDYGRQTVPDRGVVRSCDPLKFSGAPIISLERLKLKSSNFVHR